MTDVNAVEISRGSAMATRKRRPRAPQIAMTNIDSIASEAAPLGPGTRLRMERETCGMSQSEAASQLRMPVHLVQAMEAEDWSRLGVPVYARGHLRSYAGLLGLAADPLINAAGIAYVESTAIISHTHAPPASRQFEQTARWLIYVVLAAAVAVSIWWVTRSNLDLSTPSAVPLEQTLLEPAPQEPALPASGSQTPAVATAAPAAAASSAVGTAAWSLQFNGESWVQITATDGRTLEQGLIAAGQQRSYAQGEVGRVILGNVAGVLLQRGGQTIDLMPFQSANVARFTVSSDGSLAPVID